MTTYTLLGEKGVLPQGWRWVRLDSLFDVRQGVAMSPLRRQGISPHPFLRTLNILWGSVDLSNLDQMDFSDDEVALLQLREGDLLVCEGGDIGRTAIWRGELDVCLYQNHIHRLRRKDGSTIPNFYAQWLQAAFTVFKSYKGKESTTTIPNLSGGSLKSFLVPLPPTTEQKRIVSILNEQMAATEKAHLAAEARLAAARALTSAYLRTEFGEVEAKDWPIIPFEDIAILQRGYDLPFSNKISGNYPIVTSSGIAGYHNEFKAKGPGVVTGRSGSIGNVYYVIEDYWPHNTALFVKDFKGNIPRYLFYLLQWLGLETICSGTGVPTLDRKAVHKLKVKRPDIETQKYITSVLDHQIDSISQLNTVLEQEVEALNILPAALLRQAFTGDE